VREAVATVKAARRRGRTEDIIAPRLAARRKRERAQRSTDVEALLGPAELVKLLHASNVDGNLRDMERAERIREISRAVPPAERKELIEELSHAAWWLQDLAAGIALERNKELLP
jgi:hypothetical protein